LRLAASSAVWDVHALNYPVLVFSRQLDNIGRAFNRGWLDVVWQCCLSFAHQTGSESDVTVVRPPEPIVITDLLTPNYL
jgi:hypothetical protein